MAKTAWLPSPCPSICRPRAPRPSRRWRRAASPRRIAPAMPVPVGRLATRPSPTASPPPSPPHARFAAKTCSARGRTRRLLALVEGYIILNPILVPCPHFSALSGRFMSTFTQPASARRGQRSSPSGPAPPPRAQLPFAFAPPQQRRGLEACRLASARAV